jgi:hypothetical protein
MSLKKAFHTLVNELPLAETLKADLHKEIDKEKKVKPVKDEPKAEVPKVDGDSSAKEAE